MRCCFFTIADGKIDHTEKGSAFKPSGYKCCEILRGETEVYYRIVSGTVTHIICEAKDEHSAINATNVFPADFAQLVANPGH